MDHVSARPFVVLGFQALYGRAPTIEEVQPVQGVAVLETNYGQGWKGAGVGSFNMGAIQNSRPPCDPATTFQYTDTHPNPDGTSTPYSICFKKYPTATDGFADLVRIVYWRRPTVLAAAQSGSLLAVSRALYDTHYYEGFGKTRDERVNNHYRALSSAVNAIARALDESVMGEDPPPEVHRTIRRGMIGDDVKTVQRIVGCVADGAFGPHTEAAVKTWQQKHGLVADGIVGPATWIKIEQMLKLPEDPFEIP